MASVIRQIAGLREQRQTSSQLPPVRLLSFHLTGIQQAALEMYTWYLPACVVVISYEFLVLRNLKELQFQRLFSLNSLLLSGSHAIVRWLSENL